jgi:NAD(P)H-hydrate epimerase
VLTVCGSPGKSGAGILSSMAVLRAGAGLCTAAVNAGNMISPVTLQPELMTFSYVSLPEVLEKINKGLYNCLLVGPGLSNSKETADFVEKIAAMIDFPLILDADALNAIAPAIDKTFSQKKCPVVLTPHPKEFSRLSGLSIARINSDRFQAAQMFAQQKQVFLVLKGHFTVIATPTGDVFVNPSGNPGMATAGSGDVLSGIIAGFIAQFYPKFSLSEILCAAVFLHGYAADLAVSEKTQICLLAGDIIQALPDAIKQFNDYDHPFLFS